MTDGPLPDDVFPNTTRQLGELAAARALMWLHKARQNGYYVPENEPRYQDAGELPEMCARLGSRYTCGVFVRHTPLPRTDACRKSSRLKLSS